MFNIQNKQENPEKKRYQGKYRRSRIYPSFPRKFFLVTFLHFCSNVSDSHNSI